MSATTVLARKWRPKSFAQLAGQEHVVKALGNALTQNRLHHAYLFTGTRGVGKTTIARIFAKSLNCVTGITATPCGECSACTEIDSGRFVDLIELDAASNTQVDNMRELLESALYAPSSGRFKVYIIDEVHMLSKSAFNAMLKTLEEPPGHVKFILATTDPQKIPVTVLSRCLQFNLKQLPQALIASRLQYVLEQEQVSFEPAAINLVARAAQGSMRDALSLMDQAIAFSAGKVEEAVVRTMLGTIDQGYLFDLLAALHGQDGVRLLEIADDMAARSVAFDAALQELATLLHRIALAQTVPQAIADDEPERARLLELAQAFTPEDTQLFYQIAIHGRDEIDLAPDEYAGFTMTLLRMLAFAPGKAASRPALAAQPSTALPVARPAAALVAPAPDSRVSSGGSASGEVVPGGQPDWGVLLTQLNVQGMAQQLAKHCVLQCFSDGKIVLCLSQEHKHLQSNKNAIEKLQAALSDYFVKPVKLNIVLGQSGTATPAVVEQQAKQLRQQQASDSIAQDDFVREAQAELDASLVVESIRPIQ
ncbi:MAG: DNA polymerase III, subunit gamma and tau [Gallionellales bacterium RIFCSPLOWO2_12_FULL_59_22]|nr:MAG: DNA polymerase III, subunit gamma and tau [Gallionellales bacterium RIFCSPLOWO2_02_FULL_59_110]OGT04578.1 MAG: DNA polymerase III, subunit gamma and tau [Gallionellales bacterium RIFCSPLOWO2_02_58_13]OGT11213.1 MAG: DNA polymerase III, subunit gamma and tau [Gallionellales bacterium RIFCSPLOWO2_12_FULL_59_22]